MRRRAAVALLFAIASATPVSSAGQWSADLVRGASAQAPGPSPTSLTVPTLLSLVLPGAGQHALGQDRKWLYLGLEVAGWVVYAERSASGRDYRDRYRDFAWEQGRIQNGPRLDGDFDYYERLSKWTRSGAFDADPSAPGVQPELDGSTYNGAIWTLASQIYLPPGQPVPETDPAYQSALAYYQLRAYATGLLWDWSASPAGQQELGRLIESSDSRFRQATTALGAVIVNHLLSAGDAYLSARGRANPLRLRLVPASAQAIGESGAHRTFGRPPGWLAVVSVGIGG